MGPRIAVESLLSRAGDPLLSPFLRRRGGPAVSLLVFHWVGERPRHKIDLSSRGLERVLELLAREGPEVLAIDTALERLRSGDLERDAVVLTFDDGYDNFLAEVAPVLARFQAPATLSVLPYYVDSRREFEFASGAGRAALSWAELRELLDRHGDLVTIANHSWRHDDFSRLDEATMAHDVERSQELIAHELGLEARYFTYPFGFASERSDRLLGARFEALLGGRWGANLPDPELRVLRRITLFGHDGATTLRLKVRGSATSYQIARDLALAALPSRRRGSG